MRAADVDLNWLLSRLEGVEGADGSYVAWCPCHDDVGSAHKGLSITVRGKRILCKCHSPHCRATLTKVIAALEGTEEQEQSTLTVNLKPSNGKRGMAWWVQKTGVARSVWEAIGCEEYEDGVHFTFDGESYYKYRKPPKEFGWSESLGAETPPLWPYPADELPSEISIWEGESDAGTAHAAGLPFAFAVTKGSDTPLTEAHFRALAERGVTSVLVGSDTDEPGQIFRARVEKAAVDADLDVRVVELEHVIDPFTGGKDLNWVYRNCEDIEQFLTLVDRATRDAREYDPRMTPQEVQDLIADEEFFYVPGLLSPQDKAIIGGPQKSYKTWMMLDLCRSLVTCRPFMGRPQWAPASPINILLVEEEGSRRSWAKRIARLELTEQEFSRFYTWHREGFTFTDDAAVASLISYLKQHEIECVIFDPLQRMIPGLDENSSTETARVWDQIMRMQNSCPTLACIIAHHTHKGAEIGFESLRGSSRHAGEVDVGIFIEKHPLEQNRFRCKIDGRDIQTELAPGEVFEGEVAITEESFAIDAAEFKVAVRAKKVDANLDAVLHALRNGNETRTEIMRATSLSDATVRKYLQQLIEAGSVEEEDLGTGRPKVYREAPSD